MNVSRKLTRKRDAGIPAGAAKRDKAPFVPMSEDQKLDHVCELTDDMLSQSCIAFFQVIKNENWGKRELAGITGMTEAAISRVLSGQRKRLTADTIAVLARAMRKRPRLVLEDVREPARPARRRQRQGAGAASGRPRRLARA